MRVGFQRRYSATPKLAIAGAEREERAGRIQRQRCPEGCPSEKKTSNHTRQGLSLAPTTFTCEPMTDGEALEDQPDRSPSFSGLAARRRGAQNRLYTAIAISC